jgi:hypothetical protein
MNEKEEEMRMKEEEMRMKEEEMHMKEEEMHMKEDELFDVENSVFFDESWSDRTNLKSISIRGVDADIYDQFVTKIKPLEVNIGQAISKLMKDVVDTYENEFPEISASSLKIIALGELSINGHENLTINKQDLLEGGRQVSFRNCDNLKFAKDIDKVTFLKHVKRIRNCDGVSVPSGLPKLLLLSIASHCTNLNFE